MPTVFRLQEFRIQEKPSDRSFYIFRNISKTKNILKIAGTVTSYIVQLLHIVQLLVIYKKSETYHYVYLS